MNANFPKKNEKGVHEMAQLIKLLDYITRYESNPFHYPTQYIRLKQENWKKTLQLWEIENEKSSNQNQPYHNDNNNGNFRWNPFAKKQQMEQEERESFERTLPITKKQLTKHFLNELYPFQLKWATSTISHVSFTDSKYNHDHTLKFFLQRFPDIYLLMYYPIFNIKKAPIDGEIILISPVGIDIVSLMNKNPYETIVASNERTWTIETENDVRKVLSPVISLKRTEQIVRSILNMHNIDFTITKTVLSQTNNFLFSTEPYNTSIIGKREYEDWFEKKRNLHSPLKSVQLKAMEVLLHHCQTTSVRRPEWETEDDTYTTPASFEES